MDTDETDSAKTPAHPQSYEMSCFGYLPPRSLQKHKDRTRTILIDNCKVTVRSKRNCTGTFYTRRLLEWIPKEGFRNLLRQSISCTNRHVKIALKSWIRKARGRKKRLGSEATHSALCG